MPELPERKEQRSFIVEVGKIHETPAEKEGLLKRVVDLELEKPVTYKGKVLVTSAQAQKPKIILPLTQQTYLNPANWHKPVIYAIRWLLVWAQRIIKMYPKQIAFQTN